MVIFNYAIVIICIVAIYIVNSLILRRNRVKNAYATLDVMLKRRFDLIPNLVAAVKGYAAHECEVLTQIAEARSRVPRQTPASADEVKQTQGALQKIMAVAEQYPELKAGENFMHLQRSLNEVEEQIAAARRSYNFAVTDYNTAISIVPHCLVAKLFRFKPLDWYEATDDEKTIVAVKR